MVQFQQSELLIFLIKVVPLESRSLLVFWQKLTVFFEVETNAIDATFKLLQSMTHVHCGSK